MSAVGQVVAIGERARVQGFRLAGVAAVVAESPAEVRDAWRSLAADVVLVVLTRSAADAVAALPPSSAAGELPLVAVMPP